MIFWLFMMLFPRVLYYDIDKVQQKSQHVESFKLDCGFYKFHPFIFQILTYGGECLSFYFFLIYFQQGLLIVALHLGY